ncbi:MAG: GNAT family N-acetyltransferase [Thiotrichaceae bacterium]|nr:GNAT family N-acetyltransferase [Thiotrichaceae bacterium]
MEYLHFIQPSVLWDATLDLRINVFVQELNVPADLEEDEFDSLAIHCCVQDQETMIATLRLVAQENNVVKLGRLVVAKSYRRQGIATELMHYAIQYSQQVLEAKTLLLGAQCYIKIFYQPFGFTEYGDVFDDAGIPHIMMKKILS